MTKEQFEQVMGLDVVMGEEEYGVTAFSLENAVYWSTVIGNPVAIYLFYTTDPDWQAWTYVVNEDSEAVRYGGFAWGYAGEGPRGLSEMIAMLPGWHVPEHHELPDFHIEGIWKLDKKGRCKRVEVEVS